jgi:hypothetical protein
MEGFINGCDYQEIVGEDVGLENGMMQALVDELKRNRNIHLGQHVGGTRKAIQLLLHQAMSSWVVTQAGKSYNVMLSLVGVMKSHSQTLFEPFIHPFQRRGSKQQALDWLVWCMSCHDLPSIPWLSNKMETLFVK